VDTAEIELIVEVDELPEEVTSVENHLAASPPTLDFDARAVISTCEAELATQPPPFRAARLHFEIARAYDGTVGRFEQAATHYQQALGFAPDHVPTIRGARGVQILRGDCEAAAALFDAEERLSPSPKRKAVLLYQKGRLVEDRLGDAARARTIYARALELDPASVSVLKALEQCDRRADNVDGLLVTLEQTANVVSGDARHRATLIVERARLSERRGATPDPGPGPAAAELYEAALRLDPNALGALDALERIYRRDHQWRNLVSVLERSARQTTDSVRRSLALHEAARIQHERLGNRSEALSTLAKAAIASPRDRLVLEDLARAYEQVEDFRLLSKVLASLVELAVERTERVALLHRLGQVFEVSLEEPELAIERYQAALALEPTYLPVLQALGRLLAVRNQWEALVEMHLAEAAETQVATRGAAAHARVAEIFELQLRDPAAAASHHVRALAVVANYPTSLKALVRLYTQLARYRELVELLERAVADATQRSLKIAYLFKIGSVWEDSLGDPIQALHVFRRILELDPNELIAIHAVQRVAERAERYVQLVEALELEIERVDDPALRVGLLHRAGTVFDEHLGDQDAALARFRRALELDPTFVPALTSVGRIYYRVGRWQDLLDIYAREVEVTPIKSEAVALLHKMGELCEQKLGDADAVRWYLRAVELDPTYRPSIRALVRKLRERGDWPALAVALEQDAAALEHAPTLALTWYRIGQVYEEWLGDADKAIEAYRRSLENQAGYWPAHNALVRLHAKHGHWQELVGPLHQEALSTEHAIHSTAALMRLGEIYRDELKDRDLAIQRFEAISDEVGVIPALLALEPLYREAGAWQKLAGVYAVLGHKLAEPSARVAALRELARLQELHELGTATERSDTYEAIVAIDGNDETALAALEQIGRASRDDRILAGIYRRMSEVTEDDGLAASALTGLGQSLERLGDRRALDAYRAAVKKDPGVLTAIRGLARVGDLRGDPRAMAEAARLEAELTRKPELAAKLFVRAGILRQDRMNDLGAVEDYERALEVWPDDTQGAERILQPLLDTGQVQRLIDILSKTALAARSAERKTALSLEVGGLYVNLGNLGAGITAFKRALDATPGHVVALSRLAGAYQRNQQWGDAVATLEQLLTLTSDQAARAEAHLKLAAIFDENLGNIERASRSVQAVLRDDPKHTSALLRLADLQLRSGNDAEAVKTTQRLVELASTPKQKGAALVRVARIQRARGEPAAADSALGEALSLEGPGGDAELELRKAIEIHKSWIGFAAGLANYLARTSAERDAPTQATRATAYLELAKAYAEGMNMPGRAIDTLIEGLEATDGDQRINLALARRLRESGRFDDAIRQLKRAIAKDPVQPDTWRELALVFEQSKREDHAQRAMSALAVLGVAGDRVRGASRPAAATEGSFDAKILATIALDGVTSEPAAHLLITVADSLGKLYPPSLERFGLTTRDRIGPRSNSPLWEPAVRIAKIFGVELELYEHGAPEPVISIEPFETPALLVSQVVRRLPLAQQVFLLAYGMGPIASRLHAAHSLTADQLESVLVGATRLVTPTFAITKKSDEEIEDVKELLRKHLARKWRKPMEVAAAELVADPPTDLARWQSAVVQTAIRCAMLLADDLTASIAALGYVTELPPAKGAVLVQSSEAVRDLMRFWVSNRAATVRVRTGIVPA